jgi:hypothetical protein
MISSEHALAFRVDVSTSRESSAAHFARAFAWASTRRFEGFDPYDALSSPALLGLRNVLGRPFGIAATQILRRSPIDLRGWLGIRPAANAKGLGLFLAAAARTGRVADVRDLAERLRAMRAPGWDAACWGYPFPWQSRAFFLPAGTPTVVATSFVAEAFLDAHAVLGDERDLAIAVDACRFVLETLHRTEDETGACLSYSPLDRSAVYNASILGARLLVRAGTAARRDDLVEQAIPLARYVLARQRPDGSWPYGEAAHHRWIDSFHTGFVLAALDVFARATRDRETEAAVARGAAFYAARFFGPRGEPFYFADRRHPYDVHSAAQAVITFTQLADRDPALAALAARVAGYMVDRFLAPDGHFRYQLRRTHVVSIPYMRWSQAWGVRALAAIMELERP